MNPTHPTYYIILGSEPTTKIKIGMLYIDYLIHHKPLIKIDQIMSEKRTHDYPSERKPRDTSYSETGKLVNKNGLDQIKKIWKEKGMYRTAGHFDTSPYVIRYLAHKHEGKRPAEKAPAILKGVQNGSVSADHYKTLDFSNVNIEHPKEEKNEQ